MSPRNHPLPWHIDGTANDDEYGNTVCHCADLDTLQFIVDSANDDGYSAESLSEVVTHHLRVNATLRARVAERDARIAELEAQLTSVVERCVRVETELDAVQNVKPWPHG